MLNGRALHSFSSGVLHLPFSWSPASPVLRFHYSRGFGCICEYSLWVMGPKKGSGEGSGEVRRKEARWRWRWSMKSSINVSVSDLARQYERSTSTICPILKQKEAINNTVYHIIPLCVCIYIAIKTVFSIIINVDLAVFRRLEQIKLHSVILYGKKAFDKRVSQSRNECYSYVKALLYWRSLSF